MLKKKAKHGNTSDCWSSYKENFSDLLHHSETPKRKLLPRRTAAILGNVSSVSQEIQSVSSDEEKACDSEKIQDSLTKSFGQLSPVLRGFSPADRLLVKSTPSGSPILKSQRKRVRISSLIPLSPITPGLKLDYSLQNQSVFSAHLQESRYDHHSSLDQTPLAVPLDLSDNEIDDTCTQTEEETSPHRQPTQETEAIISEPEFSPMKTEIKENNMKKHAQILPCCTAGGRITVDTEISEVGFTPHKDAQQNKEWKMDNAETDISESEISPEKYATKVTNNSTNISKKLSTTGSEWIQSIKEKIDADWQHKASKCVKKDKLDLSHYDSGRKNKFISGGLAEQLTRVLKKENSQKAVFLQRLITGKVEKQNGESIVLKIISDQKEGILHVIECKEVRPKHGHGSHYYTLLLPDEFVESLNLSLGMKLRLYPPFYKIKLPSLPPVLISGYYVNMFPDTSPSNSENMSFPENSQLSSPAYRCESLLTALETQSSDCEGISIVATVQRVFCREVATHLQWSLLCEDAYGTFFDVELGEVSGENPWMQVVEFGEGQRIIFKGLALSNRVTRPQCPSLFTIIDSVWCSTGLGLLHVNNSQTDESQTSIASVPLLPPNYCYVLHSEKDLSSFKMPIVEASDETENPHQIRHKEDKNQGATENVDCSKNEIQSPITSAVVAHNPNCSVSAGSLHFTSRCQCAPPICSDLNRPTYTRPCSRDVLYNPPSVLAIKEVLDLIVPTDDVSDRFSLCCKLVKTPENQCTSQDMCHGHSDEQTFWVTDNTALPQAKKGNSVCIKVSKACHFPSDIDGSLVLILKDVYKQGNVVFACHYSRVMTAGCVCKVKAILGEQELPQSHLRIIENMLQ